MKPSIKRKPVASASPMQTVKLPVPTIDLLKGICEREGFVFGKLAARLIEAGLETEWRAKS